MKDFVKAATNQRRLVEKDCSEDNWKSDRNSSENEHLWILCENCSYFPYTMFPRWLLEGSSMPSRWSLDASKIATQKAVKMVEAGIVLRRPCATLSSSFSPCSWPPRPPPPPPSPPSSLVHDHPDCRRDSARSNFHSRFPRLAIKAVLSGSLGSK